MYIGLSYDNSRHHYRIILEETIGILQNEMEKNPFPIYQNIYSQLLDIKEMVVEKKILTDPEEIDERYSLGGIASKNFEEGDELRDRLFDIFSGACDYFLLDE